MTDVDTEVKTWGNSLAVRLPRSALRAEGIGPGDRVHVRIEKATGPNEEFWGILKRFPGRGKPLDYQKWKDAERRKERAHERERERRLRRK